MQGDSFGVSFSPTNGGNQQQPNGQRPNPIQQAIQTLSLRIPKAAGAGAFVPQQLLDSPGGAQLGMSAPNDASNMIEAIKRLLFGNPGQGPGQFGSQPSPGQVTTPGAPIPGPNPGGFQPGDPPPYLPPTPPLTPRFAPIDTAQQAPSAPPNPGATSYGNDGRGFPMPEQPPKSFSDWQGPDGMQRAGNY